MAVKNLSSSRFRVAQEHTHRKGLLGLLECGMQVLILCTPKSMGMFLVDPKVAV